MKKELAQEKNFDELMELASEQGKGYFRQGLNCAECVLKTFMDIYEVELPDEIICMATGFGGGMAILKIHAARLRVRCLLWDFSKAVKIHSDLRKKWQAESSIFSRKFTLFSVK